MVRYIVNRFVGMAKAGSAAATEDWLRAKAAESAMHIVNRQVDSDEWNDRGPYVGLSGIAVALLKAAPCADNEVDRKKMTETAHRYLFHSLTRVDSHHRYYSRYLLGDLGDLTAAVVGGAGNQQDHLDQIELIGKAAANSNYGSDEILVGRAGYLAAVLTLRAAVDQMTISNFVVADVIAATLASGRAYSAKHKSPSPLMFVYSREYLGAAHGLSGILQMLISFPQLLSPKDEADIVASADWLFSLQDATGNFPSSSGHIGEEVDEPLIHWCHGATGVIMLALVMWKRYNKPQYLEVANRCGELIWKHGLLKKGPGICHGVAGSGYALLLMWRATGDDEWLSRARCFALLMVDDDICSQQRVPDCPWSLYEGWSGALCYLVDLQQAHRDTAQFPLFPTVI